MPFRTHLLVVANQTVDSPGLMTALGERARQGAIRVTLVGARAVVRTRGGAGPHGRRLRGAARAGIEAEGVLGDADPVVAVQEVWDPGRFDEIVVSTFASGASRWMQVDLPHRVAKLTDCTVRHIESRPSRAGAARGAARHPGLLESAVGLLRTGTRGRSA